MRNQKLTKSGGPPNVANTTHVDFAHRQIRNFHTVYEVMNMFMGLL